MHHRAQTAVKVGAVFDGKSGIAGAMGETVSQNRRPFYCRGSLANGDDSGSKDFRDRQPASQALEYAPNRRTLIFVRHHSRPELLNDWAFALSHFVGRMLKPADEDARQ